MVCGPFFPLFRSVYLVFPFVWFHHLPLFLAGKSTILNHLFGTNFRKTDAFKGRCATISLYLSLNLRGGRWPASPPSTRGLTEAPLTLLTRSRELPLESCLWEWGSCSRCTAGVWGNAPFDTLLSFFLQFVCHFIQYHCIFGSDIYNHLLTMWLDAYSNLVNLSSWRLWDVGLRKKYKD